jgi:hypothetical protein
MLTPWARSKIKWQRGRKGPACLCELRPAWRADSGRQNSASPTGGPAMRRTRAVQGRCGFAVRDRGVRLTRPSPTVHWTSQSASKENETHSRLPGCRLPGAAATTGKYLPYEGLQALPLWRRIRLGHLCIESTAILPPKSEAHAVPRPVYSWREKGRGFCGRFRLPDSSQICATTGWEATKMQRLATDPHRAGTPACPRHAAGHTAGLARCEDHIHTPCTMHVEPGSFVGSWASGGSINGRTAQ